MAFGDLKGFGTGSGLSVTNPSNASGSIGVSVGDLVVAVMCEQTSLTVTAVTDNLGNTYTAQNAGTDAGTSTGRMFYSRVTVAGTLTTVSFAATASADNYTVIFAVYQGPFVVSPIDKNPANGASDIVSPFTCPATGVLSQPVELVIAWAVAATLTVTTWAGSGGVAVDIQATDGAVTNAVIAHGVTNSTATTTPAFTGTAPSADDVLGTATFKAAIPFVKTDWPNTKTVRLSEGFADQAIWAFVIPFNQTDWSKPFKPSIAPAFQQPYNPALYSVTVAAPFFQTNWPPARRVKTLPVPEYPNIPLLNLLSTPFIPVDWSSKPFGIRSTPQHPLQMALSLYANLGPFTQVDFSKAQPVRLSAPQPQPYNPNIYAAVVSAPFIPVDWSRPFFPAPAPAPISQSLNINLFTNPIPFFNLDFSRPFSPRSTAVPDIPYNLNLYTSGPVSIPFNQTDWPPTHRLVGIPGLSDQAIWAFTIPFSQTDWSTPFRPIPAVPLVQGVNLALTAPVTAMPFNQYDWPRSPTRYFRPPHIDGAIIDISVPFSQTDWPKVAAPRLSLDTPQPYNLNLYGVATVSVPFNQIDWPRAFRPRALATPDVPFNPNLYANPIPFSQTDWPATHRVPGLPGLSDQAIWAFTIPFSQTDWPKTTAIKASPDAPQPLNLNLYGVVTVSVPFAQTDWSVTRFPRARAIPDQPFNLNLFAVPVPFIPIDWSRPFVRRFAPLPDLPLNINLFTNPIPFAQFDWSRPAPRQWRLPELAPSNIALLTAVFVQPPFAQYDWTPAHRPVPRPAQDIPNLAILISVAPAAPTIPHNLHFHATFGRLKSF